MSARRDGSVLVVLDNGKILMTNDSDVRRILAADSNVVQVAPLRASLPPKPSSAVKIPPKKESTPKSREAGAKPASSSPAESKGEYIPPP